MTHPADPRTGPAAASAAPEHQPVADAFTDVPQAEGERPVKGPLGGDVDGDDMFVKGGE